MPSSESQERISDLESKVAELTALVEKMSTPPSPAPVVEEQRSSRRNMLKLAGAAAAGTAVAVIARPGAAAAVDNDPILIAATTSTTAANSNETVAVYANTTTAPTVPGAIIGSFDDTNLFTFRDSPTGLFFGNASQSAFPAALAGYSWTVQPNGVYGFTRGTGSGVIGSGASSSISGVYGRNTNATVGAGAGVRAHSASGPQVQLETVAGPGAPTTGTWVTGALYATAPGNLWYCTAGGTPGTWVNLSRAIAPLTFFPLTPYRAYDSREPQPTQGPLAMGNTRTIVIKDQRAVAGGAITTADRVPAGATTITANITVVNTVSAGFLTANPGGNTTVSAATINWSASGQILNNGVTLAIGAAARDLTVIAGGSGGAQTDFVIDVTGYFAPAAV